MLRPIPLAVALAVAAAVPAGAAPAPTTPCDRLIPDHPPLTHEVDLGGGLTAFVEDRYGGYVARYRHGAVQFSLRLRRGSHVLSRSERAAALESVDDQLDGRPTRNPFYLNSKLSSGEHTFTFVATRRGGPATTLSFPFTVGECDDSTGYGTLRGRRGGFTATVDTGANERGGTPPFTRVAFAGGAGVRARVPAAARGKVVGRVRSLGRFGNVALRVPRTVPAGASSVTLLRRGAMRVLLHPGRRAFLEVVGLPQVSRLGIELGGAGRTLVTGPRDGRLTVTLSAASGEHVAFPMRRLSPSVDV